MLHNQSKNGHEDIDAHQRSRSKSISKLKSSIYHNKTRMPDLSVCLDMVPASLHEREEEEVNLLCKFICLIP